MSDFVIENGKLLAYTGPKSGNIVIPDTVTGLGPVAPVFLDIMEGPFTLTLSANMTCQAEDLLAQEITELIIPATATVTINGGDFNSNTGDPFYKNLKAIHVDARHPALSSENGILYNKEKTILYVCPRAFSGKVLIADTVTQITAKAFYGCGDVTEVVIPDSLKEIGERAFADCKSLKKIQLSEHIREIGSEAFLRCAKIKTAGFAGTGGKKGYDYTFSWADEIPENAFNGMRSLKTVVFPETIKKIGKNAFKACASLESINLPENVVCDKKAFKDCKKLSI